MHIKVQRKNKIIFSFEDVLYALREKFPESDMGRLQHSFKLDIEAEVVTDLGNVTGKIKNLVVCFDSEDFPKKLYE